MYRVNKYLDLLDRTVWTFIQAALGALVVFGFDSWKAVLATAALAAAAAAIKAKGAQEIGDSPIGDAIPGKSVLEKERRNHK